MKELLFKRDSVRKILGLHFIHEAKTLEEFGRGTQRFDSGNVCS